MAKAESQKPDYRIGGLHRSPMLSINRIEQLVPEGSEMNIENCNIEIERILR